MWGRTFIALIVMLAILAVFYGLFLGGPSFLGFDRGASTGPTVTRILMSAVALLVGIIFGAFHRLWRERTAPLDFAAISEGLRSAELWRSILAAPLVFSGVYAAAQLQPDHVVAFFFAFQTGFFTDAVLQAKIAKEIGK